MVILCGNSSGDFCSMLMSWMSSESLIVMIIYNDLSCNMINA